MKAKTNARPAAKRQKDVALLVIDVRQGPFARSTRPTNCSRISAHSLAVPIVQECLSSMCSIRVTRYWRKHQLSGSCILGCAC